MLKYKFLAILIVLGCLILSLNILVTGYEKFQELNEIKEKVKSYQMDILNPTIKSPGTYPSNTAKLLIPKIGLKCWIRSDTVNAYDSVYHYPDSVRPGKNGECGLLGHRTTYSGPFRYIGQLKPGNIVIIEDYVLSKRYTYMVTSNGEDIRWDYLENSIEFEKSGEPRLLLITCYPPGRKKAAWITHCKLVSVSSLK
ncbi:MAG: sortase [Euryarchaeota archaeon]|nr:sortase [Euryarchaeota archaeon]